MLLFGEAPLLSIKRREHRDGSQVKGLHKYSKDQAETVRMMSKLPFGGGRFLIKSSDNTSCRMPRWAKKHSHHDETAEKKELDVEWGEVSSSSLQTT